jgi:CHAD domain-containing protein
MELELGSVRKPVRQLRKSLKGLAGDPTISYVHDLRTRSRRVEAIAVMLDAGSKRSRHHLLKMLRSLRKAAGEVRDMDVLAAKTRTLAGRGREASVELLIERLQARRVEGAHSLMEVVNEYGTEARDGLEQFSRQVERQFGTKAGGGFMQTDAAIGLMDELSRWPKFSAENLHAFRIKVKELRYVLQLTEAADPKFMTALERVKTRIGEWHDWLELRRIAGEVLDAGKDETVLKVIEERVSGKLKPALTAARALRARYLGPHQGGAVGEE